MKTGVKLALAALAVALVIGLWGVRSAGAAGMPWPPRKLTVSAPLEGVICSWWYCCGDVVVKHSGYWYSTPFPGYCKVFGQLAEGERVVATVVLRGR